MKTIYKHIDYRAFLREAFESRKSRTSGYTYKQFAMDLGFVTPSLLQLILLGQRNLQLHHVHQICRGLSFNQTEHDFFEALVHENQSAGKLDKLHYAQKCQELLKSASATNVNFVIQENGDLLRHPTLNTILLALHKEKTNLSQLDTIENLHIKTGCSHQEIASWLPLALKHHSLSQKDDLYVVDFDVVYVRRDNLAAKQQRKIMHKENLLKALEVLEKRHGEDGVKFLSHTFTLSVKDFEHLYATIKDLPVKLTDLSENAVPDGLAQLNIQFFTLVEKQTTEC